MLKVGTKFTQWFQCKRKISHKPVQTEHEWGDTLDMPENMCCDLFDKTESLSQNRLAVTT